jgi:hypothetical protein
MQQHSFLHAHAHAADDDRRLIQRRLLCDALDAVERDAVSNSLAVQQQRPALADRAKPHIQRFDDGDREPLTWFHSREAPASALIAVFDSMAKRIRTFDATAGRAAVVLMRRYSDHTGLAITTQMVHRLFLAALVVASKAHHDELVRNRDLAKVAGLHPLEVERMEAAVCVGINWRAQVTSEDLDSLAADGLVARHMSIDANDRLDDGEDESVQCDGDAAFAAADEAPSALSSWTDNHSIHGRRAAADNTSSGTVE